MSSGAVTSVISLVYSLSFAALIFSGGATGGFAQGLSALLIGTGVTALAVAVFSAFRFAVSGPDANACAVMAAMAAAIASDLSFNAAPGVAVSNVLYLLALSTLITGLCLAAMGVSRAGRWIRFIPYPVVGGLIAAAGALTVLGAIRVIGGVPVTPGTFGLLADNLLQLQFLAGILWAALLFFVLPRVKSAIVLPLLQIVGMLGFHAVLVAAGLSIEDARTQGWLFAAPLETSPWMPWHTAGFAQTEWHLLLGYASDIGTLVLVTTLTVLINATGLEMETRTDANLDRELVIQGAANIVAPLLGGFLGYLSMNRSMMNFKLGATSRLSGIVFAIVAIALALSGMGLVGYLPRSLLGGLLRNQGLALIEPERSAEDKALLTEYGDDIRIFVLQGFIFFGMADRLYRTVLQSAFPAARKARFVVLDLRLVHGVDASAIDSFKKISFSTRVAGAQLVITGMRPEQVAEWEGRADPDLLWIRHFAELDAGAEWCEMAVVNARRAAPVESGEVIRDWLRAEVGASADTLLQYLQRRTLAAGEVLCRQGQPADDMYFIESGRVAIELNVAGAGARRLRTLGAKPLLGEMGLYRSALRSADVVVEEAAVFYQLNITAMGEIEAAHPEVAARFHAMVVKAVADRLEFSNAMVAALQR